MTVAVTNTLAVVVGVEEYAAGKSWRLDGPALDACRFAAWLTARGVPTEQITLLVSPLPDNAEAVAQQSQGFRVGVADQATVREVLTTRLYQTNSDLLILYWGGHGVVDQADTRRLIYADATGEDKRNLNLTALLQSLRSSSYPGHARQLILVDTCLSLVEELGWAVSMPSERLPIGRPAPDRDQWALFAASPGEVAINDDGRKSGLFSQVLRDVLETLAVGHWPPDPEALRDTVNDRFHQLREQGRTQQVPSHLWFQSRSGENQLVFASAPPPGRVTAAAMGCRLLTVTEHLELREILDGAPAPTALRALYREATRNVIGLGLPRRADDLMSSVQALRDALSPMPLFEFLVRLAAGSDTVTQCRLWDWIHATAPGYSVDVQALETLDQQLRRTFLLLRLEPDLIDAGWQVTGWIYVGGDGRQTITTSEPWTRNRLAWELGRLVEGFHPDLDVVPPVVEFLVPLGMLDDDLETLPVRIAGTDKEIGAACPVVVRSLDRLFEPGWHQSWQDKWRELAERGDAYDEDAICWIDCAPADGLLDPAVLRGRVCTALAYACEDRPGRDRVLRTVLGAGTPVAVWHRVDGARRTRRDALEQVLRHRGLRDLPDIVRSQRVAARYPGAAADHAGRDLVLLWDDPTRIPPDLQWQPPTMEGATP